MPQIRRRLGHSSWLIFLAACSTLWCAACGSVPVEEPVEGPVAAHLFPLDSSPSGERGWWIEQGANQVDYYSESERYSSRDEGQTWSAPTPFLPPDGEGTSLRGVHRLQSGRLGVLASSEDRAASGVEVHRLLFWTCRDDLSDWQGPIQVNDANSPGLAYSGGSLIQLTSGRLVLPVRNFAATDPQHYAVAAGRIGERRVEITEHARVPEFETVYCWLSDDEGTSWFRSQHELFVWLDEGYGGSWAMDEPVVVQCADGSLLMHARTVLGQLFRSRSSDGMHWSPAEATGLAASSSPCQLIRLPDGSILCVWNQVSTLEIEAGAWRGRLSAARSIDHGQTWLPGRTLDTQGLPALEHSIENPIGLVRPAIDCGQLPRNYGGVRYPTLAVLGDEVWLRYRRRVWSPKRKNSDRFLRVPIDWLTVE